jgi:hypothetical protein
MKCIGALQAGAFLQAEPTAAHRTPCLRLGRPSSIQTVGMAWDSRSPTKRGADRTRCGPQIFRSTLFVTLMLINYALAGAAASEYS